jgi:hypothetical protein
MAGWEGVVGGALLDKAEVTIEKAYFATDALYQGGEVLVFIFEGTSPQSPLDDQSVRQFYSIGNGWDTDDGKTVTHPDLDGFRTSTNYYAFFRAALDSGAEAALKERGFPDNAGIWEGLRFYMERKHIERPGLGSSEVLVPVKFLGTTDDAPAAPAAAAAAPKASAGNKVLRAKLKKLAKEHDDHDEFLAAALEEFPEVEEDEDLYAAVLDEDGLFAEAH